MKMIHLKNTASLLVITSFPPKGEIHGRGTVGIASYAKNTLLSLIGAATKKKKSLDITVLAEKITGRDQYKENGMNICRIWKKNDPFTFFKLLHSILKEYQTKKILIEFEHAMFGSYFYLGLFPLFLALLKLFGREIIFVPHQIITNIDELSGHIGIDGQTFKSYFLNVLVNIFYKSTFLFIDKTIVFEEFMKKGFSEFTDKKKIVVIPHGVEEFKKTVSRKKARKDLHLKDEFVILCFGFIAWYKGTDWIINKIKDKKIKLIIAGGENPNHVQKIHYTDYVNKIHKKAHASGGTIEVTGFLDEKNIPKYFQAADLVVLPYRTLMSSSGPLSLAYSFEKPMVISTQMAPITLTSDMKNLLKKNTLSAASFSFNLHDGSFNKKLNSFRKNTKMSKGLIKFIRDIKEARSFEHIGEEYYKEIVA